MSHKSAIFIKEILQRYCLTKVDFCNITGISRTGLYRYLEGQDILPSKAKQIRDRLYEYKNIQFPLEKLTK